MTTEVRRMVASSIASELAKAGQSESWLAERAGIALPKLRDKLLARSDFTVVDLADIAAALGIAVADLAPRLPPEPEGVRATAGE